MRLAFKAGEFEVETWTEGYPRWVKIDYRGEKVMSIHHSEIKDLIHVLERMKGQSRATIGESWQHEFD